MSLAQLNLAPSVNNIIQKNLLQRAFQDALFPNLMYRAEFVPERWDQHLGETRIMTRRGLMSVDLAPLTPGQDPGLGSYEYEQWEATACQYGRSLKTHMPTDYVAQASTFMSDTKTLGLGAGQTLNRLARNRLFVPYEGGQASIIGAAPVLGQTTLSVSSINGFSELLVDGRLTPVSPANPITITFDGVGGPEAPNTVVGATPDDPAQPFGPGVLNLGAPLGATPPAVRDEVRAGTRSFIQRVGGGARFDDITAANVLTVQAVRQAVARLRAMNVPPHADGYYHCHLTPQGESEIFDDNEWQRVYQSLPESFPFREFALGHAYGCIFYRNTESPQLDTVSATVSTGTTALAAPEIGAELVNEGGVQVQSAIITGGAVGYEPWIDEGKFLTEGGSTGKIGNFDVTNNGVTVMTERIRYVLRAPLDALQQIYTQSWSFSGDWAIPSDSLTGDGARFKRAVVIQHS